MKIYGNLSVFNENNKLIKRVIINIAMDTKTMCYTVGMSAQKNRR